MMWMLLFAALRTYQEWCHVDDLSSYLVQLAHAKVVGLIPKEHMNKNKIQTSCKMLWTNCMPVFLR